MVTENLGTIMQIIEIPHKTLRQVSVPVLDSNMDSVRILVPQMFNLIKEKGIGLAANQVDVNLRFFITDCGSPLVFINPTITSFSEETFECEEGCLSIPGIHAVITRPKTIEIEFYDLFGQQKKETFTDLQARCIQHEMDHINGVLFIDYLSKLKQHMLIKRLEKLRKRK